MDDVYERIDQIATLDLNRRGCVGDLYAAARERAGGPVLRAPSPWRAAWPKGCG